MQTPADIIETAEIYESEAFMRSSAQLCIKDARKNLARGLMKSAARRATESLAYSVGKFSDLYTAAKAIETALPEDDLNTLPTGWIDG